MTIVNSYVSHYQEVILQILEEFSAPTVWAGSSSCPSLPSSGGMCSSSELNPCSTRAGERLGYPYISISLYPQTLKCSNGHKDKHIPRRFSRLQQDQLSFETFTSSTRCGCLFTAQTRDITATRPDKIPDNSCE